MNGVDRYAATQTFDDVPGDDSLEEPWALLIRASDKKEFKLYRGVSAVGRDTKSAVFIPGKVLSKCHAEIELTSRVFTICDKNSRNKTRRGNVPLVPNVRYELKNGDAISLGNVECHFKALRELVADEVEEEEMSMALSDSDADEEEEEEEDIPETCVFDDAIANDENGNFSPTKWKPSSKKNAFPRSPLKRSSDDSDSDSDDEFLRATQAAVSEAAKATPTFFLSSASTPASKATALKDCEKGDGDEEDNDEFLKPTQVYGVEANEGSPLLENSSKDDTASPNVLSSNDDDDEILMATQDYFSTSKPNQPTSAMNLISRVGSGIIDRHNEDDDDDDDAFLQPTQDYNAHRTSDANNSIQKGASKRNQAQSLDDSVGRGNVSSDLFTQQYGEFDSLPDSFFLDDARPHGSPATRRTKKLPAYSTIETQVLHRGKDPSLETQALDSDGKDSYILDDSAATQNYIGNGRLEPDGDTTSIAETQDYNDTASSTPYRHKISVKKNDISATSFLETQLFTDGPSFLKKVRFPDADRSFDDSLATTQNLCGNNSYVTPEGVNDSTASDLETQQFLNAISPTPLRNDSGLLPSSLVDEETQKIGVDWRKTTSSADAEIETETQVITPSKGGNCAGQNDMTQIFSELKPDVTPVVKFAVPFIPRRSIKKRTHFSSPQPTLVSKATPEKRPKLDLDHSISTQVYSDVLSMSDEGSEYPDDDVDADSLLTQRFEGVGDERGSTLRGMSHFADLNERNVAKQKFCDDREKKPRFASGDRPTANQIRQNDSASTSYDAETQVLGLGHSLGGAKNQEATQLYFAKIKDSDESDPALDSTQDYSGLGSGSAIGPTHHHPEPGTDLAMESTEYYPGPENDSDPMDATQHYSDTDDDFAMAATQFYPQPLGSPVPRREHDPNDNDESDMPATQLYPQSMSSSIPSSDSNDRMYGCEQRDDPMETQMIMPVLVDTRKKVTIRSSQRKRSPPPFHSSDNHPETHVLHSDNDERLVKTQAYLPEVNITASDSRGVNTKASSLKLDAPNHPDANDDIDMPATQLYPQPASLSISSSDSNDHMNGCEQRDDAMETQMIMPVPVDTRKKVTIRSSERKRSPPPFHSSDNHPETDVFHSIATQAYMPEVNVNASDSLGVNSKVSSLKLDAPDDPDANDEIDMPATQLYPQPTSSSIPSSDSNDHMNGCEQKDDAMETQMIMPVPVDTGKEVTDRSSKKKQTPLPFHSSDNHPESHILHPEDDECLDETRAYLPKVDVAASDSLGVNSKASSSKPDAPDENVPEEEPPTQPYIQPDTLANISEEVKELGETQECSLPGQSEAILPEDIDAKVERGERQNEKLPKSLVLPVQKSSVKQSSSKEFIKPDTDKRSKRRTGMRSKTSDDHPTEQSCTGPKVDTVSADASKRSRRASRLSTFSATVFNVIFTGAVDVEAQNLVTELNGTLVDSNLSPLEGVTEATVAVTDKASIRRTLKYLCSVAMGKPVVDFQWIFDCKVANRFIDFKKYFVTEDVLRMYEKGGKVLSGLKIHVTPGVIPSPEQMSQIITCGGGTFLKNMPRIGDKDCVIVSCKEDMNLVPKNNSYPCVDREFILTGIVTGNLAYSKYRLNFPTRSRKKN